MKNRGFSIMEVIVSIFLFFISLIPLIKYTDRNFYINRRYLEIERTYKNFFALERQVRGKNIDILLSNLGEKEYSKENLGMDRLTKDIYIPYSIGKNFKLNLNISKVYFLSNGDRFEYLQLKIMYIDNNKKIVSKKYIDINRGFNEKDV